MKRKILLWTCALTAIGIVAVVVVAPSQFGDRPTSLDFWIQLCLSVLITVTLWLFFFDRKRFGRALNVAGALLIISGISDTLISRLSASLPTWLSLEESGDSLINNFPLIMIGIIALFSGGSSGTTRKSDDHASEASTESAQVP